MSSIDLRIHGNRSLTSVPHFDSLLAVVQQGVECRTPDCSTIDVHRHHAAREPRGKHSTDSRAGPHVEGARVRLLKNGNLVAETTTDNYGDFKFDRLNENSGKYVVEISAGGRSRAIDAQLGASINLGEIRL